jgi:hypothetical protein
MTELERQLYSWTPRRPSGRLERRLFAARAVPVDVLAPFRFNWLAPATAALALACVLFNQRYGPIFSTSSGTGPMVAMILSNQSAAAYLPGSVQAERNNLPADAFRWADSHGPAPGAAALPRSPGSERL